MKFQVFKNGRVDSEFTLCGAYLFGADGIAIRRSEVTFKKGIIECKKPTLETAGLALMWPIEGFGRVLLPTTCLPERVSAYNLNVEIARAKLMQIVNKREDWSFFNNVEGLGSVCEEAQALFIQAIQNISTPEVASRYADEALRSAIFFSEKLAAKEADSLLDVRSKNRGFGRGCLGCKVEPEKITSSKYVNKLLEVFGFIMVPVNWARIETERGHYDFSSIDACMKVLGKKKIAIGAGPLLCFSQEYLPKWLQNKNIGFETILETAYQFISQTVSRYSGSVRAWRVISGLNALNYFGFNFEQVLEMTRAANMAVKAAGDRALKIVEISNPWGEYYVTEANTIPPLVYIDMIIQGGINFDAFGLQMWFGDNKSGMLIRDMMHLSSLLDYFGPIAKTLYITDVEIPSESPKGRDNHSSAGLWHGQWNQKRQGQWIEQFYKIAISKPFVDSVVYSNLVDAEDYAVANSGLLTGKLEPKESFQTLKKIHKDIFGR